MKSTNEELNELIKDVLTEDNDLTSDKQPWFKENKLSIEDPEEQTGNDFSVMVNQAAVDKSDKQAAAMMDKFLARNKNEKGEVYPFAILVGEAPKEEGENDEDYKVVVKDTKGNTYKFSHNVLVPNNEKYQSIGDMLREMNKRNGPAMPEKETAVPIGGKIFDTINNQNGVDPDHLPPSTTYDPHQEVSAKMDPTNAEDTTDVEQFYGSTPHRRTTSKVGDSVKKIQLNSLDLGDISMAIVENKDTIVECGPGCSGSSKNKTPFRNKWMKKTKKKKTLSESEIREIILKQGYYIPE